MHGPRAAPGRCLERFVHPPSPHAPTERRRDCFASGVHDRDPKLYHA
jgi:hypothetical protein